MTEKTKKSKLSFEDACFQWASGFYLTDHLPDDFFIHDPDEWTEEEWEEYKDDLLENSLWQPFEFYDASEIAKEIASLSHWIENGRYPKKRITVTKEEAENFVYKCLVDNESKTDPKEKLTRLDICDILHNDFEIPRSTAYRYYKDSFNLYKWEQAKPDPSKKIKDTKDTILDSVLDEAEGLLADGDSVGYFKGIELYSKLLTRFKKQ